MRKNNESFTEACVAVSTEQINQIKQNKRIIVHRDS